nr:TlpA disulfide reductase family protein [Geotalea sp. SG265]
MIWAWGSLLFSSGCEQQHQGVKIGEVAPQFSGKDIYGKAISLGDLKGKIVVIYFWANTCCGNNLKHLEPFYDNNRDKGLAILAINERDSGKEVESYAKNNGVTFTMLSDDNSAIFKRYHGLGFPTIFILDRNGIIREKILGSIQVPKLEKLIQRQLQAQKEAEASYEKLHRH